MNKQSPLYIIGFMIVISAVFAFGVSYVNYVTADMLKKNETLHTNRTIAGAFSIDVEGTNAEAYKKAVESRIEITEKDGLTVYRDKETGSRGFLASGTGFWDTIKCLVVLAPDYSEMKNIRFLEQKETPGLGARIEEKWFTDQFQGLQIDWESKSKEYIIIGQSSDDGLKNRVDAITGATQTSIAVMGIINKGLGEFKKNFNVDTPEEK